MIRAGDDDLGGGVHAHDLGLDHVVVADPGRRPADDGLQLQRALGHPRRGDGLGGLRFPFTDEPEPDARLRARAMDELREHLARRRAEGAAGG